MAQRRERSLKLPANLWSSMSRPSRRAGEPLDRVECLRFHCSPRMGSRSRSRSSNFSNWRRDPLPQPGLTPRDPLRRSRRGEVRRQPAPSPPPNRARSNIRTAGCWCCSSIRRACPWPTRLRAQQAALKFLKTQMTQSDLVSVMTYVTDLRCCRISPMTATA